MLFIGVDELVMFSEPVILPPIVALDMQRIGGHFL